MINYLFPEGRKLLLTFSYDDGNACDRHLADMFTEYGMKGTFNLNTRYMDRDTKIHPDELKKLFIDRGHEVACHGYDHPFEEKLPLPCVVEDIRHDRLALEKAVGAPVRGMAYPFGTFSNDVKTILHALGIAYCRTVRNCKGLTYMPDDFLEWDPTTHHNGNSAGVSLLDQGKGLLNSPEWRGTAMLYVWGHAFELENSKNWFIMEDFCKLMAHHDEIWYATNIEIYDYIMAYRRLNFSMDFHLVHNPSAISVWLKDDAGKTVEVKPGALAELA